MNNHEHDSTALASRKMRRKLVLSILIYCALVVGYIVYKGSDTRIYETVVTSLASLAGFAAGAYIAGGAWENVCTHRSRGDDQDDRDAAKARLERIRSKAAKGDKE